MANEEKSYGTIRGVEITDTVIEQMADEAEAGYDVETLKRRGPRNLNETAKSMVDQVVEVGFPLRALEVPRDISTNRIDAELVGN